MTWTPTDREHECCELSDAAGMLRDLAAKVEAMTYTPTETEQIRSVKGTLWDIGTILNGITSHRDYRDFIPGDEQIQPRQRVYKVTIFGYVDDGDPDPEVTLYTYHEQGALHRIREQAQAIAQSFKEGSQIIAGTRFEISEVKPGE